MRKGAEDRRAWPAVAVASALAASLAAVAGGAAQEPASSSEAWLPWLGCWVEVGAPADAPMTCVVPVEGGVELRRVTDPGVAAIRPLAEGRALPSGVEGCTGVESAAFSADRQRVFVEARRTCEGGVERVTHGILALLEAELWVEVEAARVAGRDVAWARRYRPAPLPRVEAAGLGWLAERLAASGLAVETARLAATSPLSVEDVIEATERSAPEAVRTWVAESGKIAALDADRLVRMADAGVPPEVIDVVVAVSYPERFRLGREAGPDEGAPTAYGAVGPWGYLDPYGWSYRDPFFGYYSRYGYYSRFGRYGGLYGYPYWGVPTVVVVRPADEAGGDGRAVNGRGYTRGGSTGGSLRPARPAGSWQGRPSAAPSPSAAPAAAPSGRSARPTKGQAKPRGGG